MSIKRLCATLAVGILLALPPELNDYYRKVDPYTRVSKLSRLGLPGDMVAGVAPTFAHSLRVTDSIFLMKGVVGWMSTATNVLFYTGLAYWSLSLIARPDRKA